MIKPEIDLELSINALEVYGVEPNIINNMLDNLNKLINNNHIVPTNTTFSVCPVCGTELQIEIKNITNSGLLNALKKNNI